jgi:hypothetical protein
MYTAVFCSVLLRSCGLGPRVYTASCARVCLFVCFFIVLEKAVKLRLMKSDLPMVCRQRCALFVRPLSLWRTFPSLLK